MIEGQEYMKDKRALIVAQRTCDDEDWTMSQLRDSEDEGISQ